MEYEVYCDGGARGNPGKAAIGVVIKKSGQTVHEISRRVGETTNNVAEYQAVIAALSWFVEKPETTAIRFFLDSLLVVKQLQGEYKIKNFELLRLANEVRFLGKKLKVRMSFQHVPRELNRAADRLVNLALDSLA